MRQHFARTSEGGWHGIHSEGGIWATLFGLCFWDVTFSGARVLVAPVTTQGPTSNWLRHNLTPLPRPAP